MPRFAANLSMLYAEHDFLDRFAAAARDGFAGVEYLFPYAWPAPAIAERLAAHGLTQVLFNAPPGDWAAGERGLACLPGREAEFQHGIELALQYARQLGCERVHVMAGIAPAGAAREALHECYVQRLRWAAQRAAAQGVRLLIEPINGRDMPGYFVQRQAQAHALVQEIAAANVQVQLDLYHLQIMEGDVAMALRRDLPTGRVGHLQIAGVPERGEPDQGELSGPYLFGVIDELAASCGWGGWVGCEYRPRDASAGGTTRGLAWMRRWLEVKNGSSARQ
ncbi:2-oxo-tetronate isomerase [Pulveribacter suum]|uniref:Hydroxypyruvate isomerase n=1 Tax=Pulveribacter suum TaxID=2116657 RepID=A0A2P1NKX0_9BURK|nr:2-oxo-tetronate isomerase [Pulveribacter suum]AVP57680.1 hydroxypyruvate isomerase [Pulveribacter suum]